MAGETAADSAKVLLHGAARRLHTADPVHALGSMIDESLEPRFSELAAGSLAFDLRPGGPSASAADRVRQATETVRAMTARSFGSGALRWVDGRLDVAGDLGGHSATWGASM